MKHPFLIVQVVAFAAIMITGCALFNHNATPEQKSQDVYKVSYALGSLGTSTALIASPAYRAGFELAWSGLDQYLLHTNLTGVELRNIVADLPFKQLRDPAVSNAVNVASFLFDVTTGGQLSIGTNLLYLHSAGRGLHDGIGAALGK